MDTFQTYNLLGSVPLFLVWGAGALMCVYWSTRRPGTAKLVGVGILIAVVREAAWAFRPNISDLLERLFVTPEAGMLALYLTFSIPEALAWGVMLWAVFREVRLGARSL